MRIVVITVGSRGDVVPYAALAQRLARDGNDVTFATHKRFEALAATAAVRFAELGDDPVELLQTEAGRAWLASNGSIVPFMRNFVRLARPQLAAMLDQAYAVTADADAIVYYARLAGFAASVADVRGIPAIAASTAPFTPTRAFPAVGAAELPLPQPVRGLYNLATHRVAEQLFWQPFRREVDRWRAAHGLARATLGGPDREREHRGGPMLYAYSEALLPRPPDWDATQHVTGFWFLDDREAVLDPVVEEFLAAGPPPVLVGFGSMVDADPHGLATLVVRALAQAGRRGILLGGWGDVHAAPADGILQIAEAPHDVLLPRCAAAVHHGGLGTVAAALRAGVPSVAVPYFADQFFWGRRLAAVGAGVEPLPRQSLTAERLAAAIRRLALQADAGPAGVAVRSERGAEAAARVVAAELAGPARH